MTKFYDKNEQTNKQNPLAVCQTLRQTGQMIGWQVFQALSTRRGPRGKLTIGFQKTAFFRDLLRAEQGTLSESPGRRWGSRVIPLLPRGNWLVKGRESFVCPDPSPIFCPLKTPAYHHKLFNSYNCCRVSKPCVVSHGVGQHFISCSYWDGNLGYFGPKLSSAVLHKCTCSCTPASPAWQIL